MDIHYRSGKGNFYGPVLFVFDINILAQDWLPSLWISKSNPQRWNENTSIAERYFSTIDEFRQNYQLGNFDKMLVLRHTGGILRLRPFLKRIILDDPQTEADGINLYSQAIGALRASARAGKVDGLTIERHNCKTACECVTKYAEMQETTWYKFFAP